MEDLNIQASERKLAVSLSCSGKLSFTGRSIPEDAKAFFTPIVNWLQEYALAPAPRTECSLKMEYFNSSSRKCFVDVFHILDSIRKQGNTIVIIWHYEEDDDELKEIGEKYRSIYEMMEFQLIPY